MQVKSQEKTTSSNQFLDAESWQEILARIINKYEKD